MTDEQRKAHIAALLAERRGYEIKGDKERLAAVDAELAKIGHEAKPPAKRAQRRRK